MIQDTQMKKKLSEDLPKLIHICCYRVFRDIYYAKYYGKGGEGWPAGEKMKLGVREKK